MKYDAVVIGAGTAGLTAALQLALAGKKVVCLEKQPVPGGFATSFSRKGFLFESSVHCVDALSPGGEVREFLETTGVARQLSFIPLPSFARLIYPQHNFVLYFGRAGFIKQFKENFPEESGNIDRFFTFCDSFYRQFDAFCESGLPGWLNDFLIPFIYPLMMRVADLTVEGLLRPFFKDERLKAMIAYLWGFMGLPSSQLSAFYFLVVFRGYCDQETSYIKGGFARLYKEMVSRIESCGGRVLFNARVDKILTDAAGKVCGVSTDKGVTWEAPVIISNANPFDTFLAFPDTWRLKAIFKAKLLKSEKSISAFQVYLGLKKSARSLGMDQSMFLIFPTYDTDKNYSASLAGAYEQSALSLVDHAQIDSSVAPEGKGSLLIMALDSYENWEGLSKEDYRLKKEKACDQLIARAEKYLPGLTEQIEVKEAATPVTMERYGCAPRGAIYGFAQTVGQAGSRRLSQKTPLENLFLAGAWSFPGGGVHACFISGIMAAESAIESLKKQKKG